jgi:hypothetical protein
MKSQIYNHTLSLKALCVLIVIFISSVCLANENPNTSNTISPSSDYISISIDEIVVDTRSLTQMTNQLSMSIRSLSNSIKQLSTSDSAFDEPDRQTLIAASQAITKFSRELPLAMQSLTREVPDVLKQTQTQITAMSKSIQSAGEAALYINDSFPDTLSKGKVAMNEITVGIMQNITLYIGLILVIFVFILAAVMYIIYKTSIQPIAIGLSALRAVPEQLSDMSAYMHDTSKNLLNLEQQQKTRVRRSRSTMARSTINRSKIGRLK